MTTPESQRMSPQVPLESQTQPTRAHDGNVLVIDDDPDIVRLLVDLLHDEGYGVRAAYSIQQALTHGSPAPPDVILLDIMLPGEDLVTALGRLRSRPGWASVPVILCSGHDRLDALARRVGAAGVLRKPYHLDAVLDAVQRHSPAHHTEH